LQEVLRRVKKAFDAFFRRVKNGETPGYPRFQGKGRYASFTYPQGGFELIKGKVVLSKIGYIKVKLHRPLSGKIKTCTLKKEGEHWYVIFACEIEQEQQRHMPYTDEAVGIDLGIHHFAALSTGDVIDNPRAYRNAEKKLVKAHQEVSRKKKGSNRRKKAVKRLSSAYRKVASQRADFLHQWSRRLVNTYTMIVFEDLSPSHMSKRPKPKQDEVTGQYLPNGAAAKSGLNKSIFDAGWSTFVALCESKAAWAGTIQVIRVDPKYTSQVCCNCGKIRPKTLDERWHSCECGCELDRDVNSAKAIKDIGLGHSLQGG
jgi:putative transposase